ncbi:MAG TPA: chlorite dismutase family protein, partial [Polyangiaceae bacterium]|nr:chlorite dismutase family protein [Polyangiaceae bacterium]
MPTELERDSTSSPRLAQSLGRRGFVGGALVGLASCDAPRGATSGSRDADRNPRLFTFVGGDAGAWSVVEARAVVGPPLAPVKRLDIIAGAPAADAPGAAWSLRGVTSNERYTVRAEKTLLAAKQAALGRPEATHAALIPIRKNAAWWALTQDERRAIFEDRSNHVKVGLKYLPAVARRLHHCRDLGAAEPFDFVTLFDYTKADTALFE